MINCRPSAAYIWSNCAAYPSLVEFYPKEPDTDAAREGTCAAWVAEQVMRGVVNAAVDMVNQTHENGWLVDFEMCQHVQKYVDLCRCDGGIVSAEQFVRLSPYIAGTLDSSIISTSTTLKIKDLKYGFQLVEVYEHKQLIIYGAAELMRIGCPAHITHVELAIYQPRAFHHEGIHRPWTLTVQELFARAQELIAAAERCNMPNPVATPGPHCFYCSVKTRCVANAQSVYAGYHHVTSVEHREMSDAELREEFLFLKEMVRLAKSRYDAVEAEIDQKMKNGTNFMGLFRKPRKGHRKWLPGIKPEMIEFFMGQPATEVVALSPPEMEKAGANIDIVKALSYSPDIGAKVDRLPADYFAKAFKK